MRLSNAGRLVSYLCLITLAGAQGTPEPLSSVSWKTDNSKINNLVLALTPEEKISLVTGANYAGTENYAGYLVSVPRLGIPAIQLADGEAGINNAHEATAIPNQINVGATWSRSLAFAAGKVTGLEARLQKATVALAPRVNILRDPFTGHAWQSYSEDAYLNAQLGIQGVNGIQGEGTMANTKQIGPSSSGASHGDVNSEVDLQVLHEVYWAPHEALIEAGVATIMCSYSQVNGVPACQYAEMLNDTLRGDYNFTGIVVSDWGATHSTAESIQAGLDLEMGSRLYYTENLYDQIYVQKKLSESYLNRALHRVLSTYDRFGLIGNHSAWNLTTTALPQGVIDQSAAISYDIAVRSGVLLKNDKTLPLEKNLSSIAVLGPSGVQYNQGAGFAERAYGILSRIEAPLKSIQRLTSGSTVKAALGVDVHGVPIPAEFFQQPDGQPGLLRNDSNGETTTDSQLNFSGTNALAADRSYTWNGLLQANTTGYYRIALQRRLPTVSGGRNHSDFLDVWAIDSLTVNGTEFEGFRLIGNGGARPWSSPLATEDGWDETGSDLYLEAGLHNLSITATKLFDDPMEVRLSWVTPEQRALNIREAVEVASSVEVPVIFAHANSPADVGMQLNYGFDELISRVAAQNPKTIVVLITADPITMPWLDDVAAVLWMGYPGQEGARATASLLFGDHTPQGRLPVTYPAFVNTSLTRNPDYPERMDTENGTAVFSEGINSAYRWYLSSNTPTLFPFGFGLSYTSFEYSNIVVAKDESYGLTVSVSITNTGVREGVEISQVYIGPPLDADMAYPGIQFAVATLVGFDDVQLKSGESTTVRFAISRRQLSYWNQEDRSWVLAKGKRSVWIGTDAETKVFEHEIGV